MAEPVDMRLGVEVPRDDLFWLAREMVEAEACHMGVTVSSSEMVAARPVLMGTRVQAIFRVRGHRA